MKSLLVFSVLYLFGLISAYAQLTEKFQQAKGWGKAGSHPQDYDMGVDNGSVDRGRAATIQSKKKKANGFGTLMQNFSPEAYKGKRIRMSGYMRCKDVKKWAGFWLRIDCPNKTQRCEFDNMEDRAVTGTTDWQRYDIVLNVGPDAINIACGALLTGTGKNMV